MSTGLTTRPRLATIGVYGFDVASLLTTRGRGHRLRPPARARPDHRTAPAPVRRGQPAGRRQAVTYTTGTDVYVQRYTTEVLDHADLDLAGRVLTSGRTAALLCVEATPAACHRSLVAMRLAKRHDVELLHLLPGRREATAVDPHRRNDP